MSDESPPFIPRLRDEITPTYKEPLTPTVKRALLALVIFFHVGGGWALTQVEPAKLVVGDIAGFAFMGFAGRMREDVPIGRAAAVGGNRALNLIGAGGAAPEEIRGKSERLWRRRLAESEGQRHAAKRARSADGFGDLAPRETFQWTPSLINRLS